MVGVNMKKRAIGALLRTSEERLGAEICNCPNEDDDIKEDKRCRIVSR